MGTKVFVRLAAWLLPVCLLTGCTVPAMKLDGNLGAAEAMDVHGRQGWQVNQVLNFGPYRSGPVKRGWTKGYYYPFTIRFTAAKEKLAFESLDGQGRRAEFFCVGKLSKQDLHKFEQYFDINLRTSDVFSCTVVMAGGENYDFFIKDLNQNSTSGDVTGKVRGTDVDIAIRPVWQLASGQKSWGTRPLGLEFVAGGTVVGAVETVNEGRVWLDRSRPAGEKLLLAGVASAVLLRSDLADHND